MAWTYTALPGTVPVDLVRMLLGDTDTTDQLCQDSEVAFALSTEINAYLAAAFLADTLAARFTRDETISADGVSVGGGRSQAFRVLAANLRQRAGARIASTDASRPSTSVIVSGVRPDAMAAAAADPTRIAGAFVRINDADVLSPYPLQSNGEFF